jgi:putative transposase
MTDTPATHHRRSIRLRGYDYSQAGAYFITICTHNRECLFGEIVDGEMRLRPFGRIVTEQWNDIPSRFPVVAPDAFTVMPNHIHGIIVIVGAPLAGAQSMTGGYTRATARVAPTTGDIIGAYKSLCVHHCLKWINLNASTLILGQLWQRNYWEHIIRNETELNRIREYIRNNPAQWESDRLYGRPVARPNEISEPVAEYGLEDWME